MKKGNEVFVGIDMAEAHNAVAVAEAGRDGEVRYLGTFDNAPDAVVRQTGWTLPSAALLLRSRINGTRAVLADSTVRWIKNHRFCYIRYRDEIIRCHFGFFAWTEAAHRRDSPPQASPGRRQ